jgi:hypothetical protein
MWEAASLTAAVFMEEWLNMPRRPLPRNGRGALTPATQISLTVVQFIAVLAIVSLAVGGYWWLESNVTTAAAKVDTFSAKLDQAVKANTDQFKDQDNKREQLGKDFLASQQQIVAKVSELNTAVTVQQHDTKTIADTLSKISDQLSAVSVSPAGKPCVGRC